jgi:hypothetical protein
MSVRDLINQPTRVVEEVVEYGDSKYLFRGKPDANVMADTLLLTPDRTELLAAHWKLVCEQEINPKLVKHILVVHAALVAATWDESGQKWVDEPAPYDVTEIATLACKEGPLFLLMMNAAYKALGIGDADVKSLSTFDQVAAGNLEKPDPASK